MSDSTTTLPVRSMNDLRELAAKILVLADYQKGFHVDGTRLVFFSGEECNPFYSGEDTKLECYARRQLDAIEDWLYSNSHFWEESQYKSDDKDGQHCERLQRIKWCLRQEVADDCES